MNKYFETKYLLTHTVSFLTPDETINLFTLNKAIGSKINPETNPIINDLFYKYTSKKLYTFDHDDESDKGKEAKETNKKDIFKTCLKKGTNWRLFLSKASHDMFCYPDKTISKRVLNCFKVHVFLPDLRKENHHLEFDHSTSHQLFCYDKKYRDRCSHNFYSKYINENYINKHGKECVVKILREGLFFEKELKTFIDTYDEFSRNKEYISIVQDANAYDFQKLAKIYKDGNFPKNNIISFIPYIIRNCINYSKYILENINEAKNENDKNKFLEVYSQEYNNYINASLLINSNFANVNLIINLFNKLYFKKDAEFSLYSLSIKIYEKNVFDIFKDVLFTISPLLYKNIIIKKIEIKKEYINDMEKEDYETDSSSFENISIDDYVAKFELEKEENKEKRTLEKAINCVTDFDINKENANAINHTHIKLGPTYDKFEASLINILKETIKEKIGQFPLRQITENLMNLFESEKSGKNSRDSLRVINRTKKAMLVNSFESLYPDLLSQLCNDFNLHINQNEDGNRTLVLSNNEKLNNRKYNCDLSDFSRQKRMKIEEKVENDIKDVKTFLLGKNINGYDMQETQRLIDEYMENDGIECVLLIKKLIYFYNKECFIYDDKDQKIFNILTNRGKEEETKAFNEIIKL